MFVCVCVCVCVWVCGLSVNVVIRRRLRSHGDTKTFLLTNSKYNYTDVSVSWRSAPNIEPGETFYGDSIIMGCIPADDYYAFCVLQYRTPFGYVCISISM